MKQIIVSLRFPVIASFLPTIPFMILEALNRQNFEEGFPMTLFGAMWLLPVLFFTLLMPLLRSARSGKGLMAKPVPFLFGVAFLALFAVLWTATVIDQMPCFLGVPLCD